ncbi:Uncharacterised protein [Mycobacteroides abscessus subsp. abscessus]|nr:Uncharacterised protein [Mycobacteroides abscessus subsp. abscessus]
MRVAVIVMVVEHTACPCAEPVMAGECPLYRIGIVTEDPFINDDRQFLIVRDITIVLQKK